MYNENDQGNGKKMVQELTWAGEPFSARAEFDGGHSFSVAR